jgi:dCTP deaminase
MLLSQKSLQILLSVGKILGYTGSVKSIVHVEKQKPASIDLTIGKIFEPMEGKKIKSNAEIKKLGEDRFEIEPGNMVIVEIAENFNMPTDIGGILFPPNRLAKEGLLMTNPGHIDPGFKGLITVCLVNMGKQNVKVLQGDVIARLLLCRTDLDTPGYKGEPGKGVDKHQLNSLDKDFAGLNRRLPGIISIYISKNLALLFGILGVVLAAYTLILPELGKYRITAVTEKQLAKEMFSPFKRDILNKIKSDKDSLTRDVTELKLVIKSICKDAKSNSCSGLN